MQLTRIPAAGLAVLALTTACGGGPATEKATSTSAVRMGAPLADTFGLGLSDASGFDEVRYFAFATANRTSGFSAAAIDNASIGLPEPGTALMFATGLLGLGGLRRSR